MNLPPSDDLSPPVSSATGYASNLYAQSLAEFGDVIELPRSGGALLAQAVPGGGERDLAGPYPLFSCLNWSGLADDLTSLRDRFVCAYAVSDPFAKVQADELQRAFPDVCYAYKQHFVTDLARPLESFVDSHHRRNIRKGLRNVEVRQLDANPAGADFSPALNAWQSLYQDLIERHGIEGIARFSRTSFERQFAVPGFDCFAAVDQSGICGMTLWYSHGEAAYYHLGAYNERGYTQAASFALFATAFQCFAERGVRWAALGAGAGTNAVDSGLTRFKQGWSTETRPVYFCGRILQREAYSRLAATAPADTKYFPAYRGR